MDYDFQKSVFYRAFMTALFVGLITTLIVLLFDNYFVLILGHPLSAIINVSSIIFGVNIIFLIIGIIYYLCIASSKKGDILYIILFVALTVFLAWQSELVHRTTDTIVNQQFRNLLTGIVIIIGAMATFLVPFLYHNKKFEEHVL